ncbi:MAG: T9SS type A sorting domain-containing protein [Muribaculum sp.]|nr:T9SS type A sorting domain-containing protein [Muribaculum sp.]
MKYLITPLICSLAINCFAEEPQPPAPSEPDGIIRGHEYVNLGLPSGTLWATYNVGATSPYEKGHYFAWGEVEPREDFSWESYKFFEGYEADPNNGEWVVLENIGADICGTEYDAARYQWGSGWRLPNEQERYELQMLCWSNGLSEENGVRGVRIYGPNEHSIFLPICGGGLWYGQQDPFHNTDAAYWTGVEMPEYGYNGRPIEPSNVGMSMLVDLAGFSSGHSSPKAYGLNIRAVVNPKESGIDNIVSDNDKVRLAYHNSCIHVSGKHSHGMIKVFDLSGRMTFSDSVVDGTCLLPKLADGIYIISYADKGNRITTQKITIK